MKKFNLMAVVTGLLLLSSPAALFADDATDTKPTDKPNAELREKLRNMTPEERKEWAKEHPEAAKKIQANRGNFEKNKAVLERAGLKPDDIKDLPPAERRAKVKEVIDTRVGDLEKKKSGGTALTEQEQSDLDSLNQLKGMVDRQGQQRGIRQPKAQKPSGEDTK
ncbi:MAG: hypothetical protein JWO95_3427 [Verrucomicrobiales bacterium]|nr:hypothetical protein [Verrucomicrobiales bacterium]